MRFIRFGGELWDMPRMPPGLQLYTVRNELEKDYLGTLKKVAEMGYKWVEFALGYGGIPITSLPFYLQKGSAMKRRFKTLSLP
jgi:hypothetical protein